MNQTWEYGKKPIFGPNFDLLDSNLGLQIFFAGFSLLVVLSYHAT